MANLKNTMPIQGKLVPAPLILNHGARWGEPLGMENHDQSSTDQHISKLRFYENTRKSNFFVFMDTTL